MTEQHFDFAQRTSGSGSSRRIKSVFSRKSWLNYRRKRGETQDVEVDRLIDTGNYLLPPAVRR